MEIEYKEEIDAILASYKKKAETKQYIIGKVVSDKASKSITVQLQRQKYIPKYNCFQNVRKKFMAHDELEQCGEGDIVRVVPCRPMSRKKRFKLYEIIKKAPVL